MDSSNVQHGRSQTQRQNPPPLTADVDTAGDIMTTAGDSKLRVFFIPFFASGHLIPMVDLAVLFARRRNVEPTMVVTPANATLIEPSLRRAATAGHHVNILTYPFPAAAGLPAGKENLSSVSADDTSRVYLAVGLSRAPQEELLRCHRPDAIVADIAFQWTTSIACEIGVPCVMFHAVGMFPQCVMNLLYKHRPQDRVAGEYDPFDVTSLPGPPVQLVRSEIPDFLKTTDFITKAWGDVKKAEKESYGVVINTYYDFEKEYCDFYRATYCRRAWFVGPVSAAFYYDAAERGGAANDNTKVCMRWLENQPRNSVVFVCFGSWCYFSAEQLKEIALGLEESGERFLWVVRGGEGCGAGENWLPEGWEKRVHTRGLLVTGWAPQTAVLGHEAVGAFLSHCGWNSLLEAMAAGVPVLTWPLVFEQFINERLVVELAGAGARVWNGRRSTNAEEPMLVPRSAIASAAQRFMGGREEAVVASVKAAELGALAKAAVVTGGSSNKDLNDLIDGLMQCAPGTVD